MKRTIYLALSLAAVVSVFASCSRMDDYLKYAEGKQHTYIGRPDSVAFLPGLNRVKFYSELSADPKVRQLGIFWNNRADSLKLDVDLAAQRVVEHVFEIPEGSYNFEVFAYDDKGSKSVASNYSGISYGEIYISALYNRVVKSYSFVGKNLVIEWHSPFENTDYTVVEYTDAEGNPAELVVNNEETSTTIETPGSDTSGDTALVRFSVTSHYTPDPLAIDDFTPAESSQFELPVGPADVTSDYLTNAVAPIQGAEINGQWGVPMGWNITDNVRNQQGNTVGGWKKDPNGEFHVESQDWGGPGFENGKIWQSPTLPAGTYSFTVHYLRGNTSDGQTIHLAASEGGALPDRSDLALNALAFKLLPRDEQNREHTITFTLTESRQVSLGLVITLDGSEQYLQFTYFKLSEVTPLDITADHLSNALAPIQGAEINGQWGVPMDWNVTDNVRNQQGNTVGGWKKDPNGEFHVESQDWGGPGFENGKIWQSRELPAGTYALTVYYIRGNTSDGQTIHLAVDDGDTLPDRNDMPMRALAYKQLGRDKQGREHTVTFTLFEPKQVSMGLVITLDDREQYLQFQYFKLAEIPR